MAGTFYAGFDLARTGSMSVVVSDGAVSSITATVTTDTYCHVDLSAVIDYTAFSTAVEAALLVASPSADYALTFDTTTRLYTIANAGNPFTLDFTSTAGQRLAKALGITAANALMDSGTGYSVVIASGGTDLVSDVLPYYLVPLARANPMHWSRPYEADGFVHRNRSTNANRYEVHPLTIPEDVDFSTAYVPLANVFETEVAAAQPWTIQHMIKHARGTDPIMADWTAGRYVMKLSERDSSFGKDLREVAFPQAPEFHNLWHLKFAAAAYLGKL